jgi:phage host-nuclease inhibitor protein Gam
MDKRKLAPMEKLLPIKSREQAGEVIAGNARLVALLKKTLALRDQRLIEVREDYKESIENLQRSIDNGEARLRAWADENRAEEFGDSQFTEFTAGTLKYRMGPSKLALRAGATWEKALQKLLAFGPVSMWAQYIRKEPEIDKRKLLEHTKEEKPGTAKLPPAQLEKIGLKIVRDEFFQIDYIPQSTSPDVPRA